jgi:vancomycin resistance protein VanW
LRGFRPGAELREGCVIPSIGGGLCLISSALFRLAARLDFEILERHGHTAGGCNRSQIDATLMWPHVDLVIAPRRSEVTVLVEVDDNRLLITARGRDACARAEVERESLPSRGTVEVSRVVRRVKGRPLEVLGEDRKTPLPSGLARNCLTCDEDDCLARASYLKGMR